VASAPTPLVVEVSHAAGARGVRPDEPVHISVTGGRIERVTLAPATGPAVEGELDPDGAAWATRAVLRYGTRYTARVTAVDASGARHTKATAFTTLTPKKMVKTSISPLTGTEVGVGMPIVVKLSVPVADRAAVERGLTVTASRPVEGAWHWIDDEELHYRPRAYWPARTDVTLRVGLVGVHAGKGVWGAKDRTIRFRVGSATVSTVDVRALRMQVFRDGKLARSFPVTTGKKGFLTRGGVKVISEKYPMKVMDAATINIRPGDPEYYRLKCRTPCA
jgi:lipoprotein-anchoring transpeptidase ErfK/SrfK